MLPARSRWLLACLAGLAGGLAAACDGDPAGDGAEPAFQAGTTHVRLEGPLDGGHLSQLQRAVRGAQGRGDQRLVVEIDTPGGEVERMWQLAKQIDAASGEELVTVAWVHDHALSAGVLLALSCDKIYLTPQGTIGAAMPVTLTPGGIAALPEEDGAREKVTSALRAEFRARAEKRGRPPALAVAMVDADVGVRLVDRRGERVLVTDQEWDDAVVAGEPPELVRTIARRGTLVSLSGAEAVELGFADGLAGTLEEVQEKIGHAGAARTTVERLASDDAIAWLDRLAPLLLLAGLVLAWVEIKAPGFGLPGILSVACFVLLLVGRYLTGLADVPHLVAVAAGVVLILVEIFVVPGTLWLGIGGALLVLGGLLLAGIGPGLDLGSALDRRLLVDSAFGIALSSTLAVVVALALSRFLPRTPGLRRLVLDPALGATDVVQGSALPEARSRVAAGAGGRARTPLRPVGKVVLDAEPGHEWEARAEGGLVDAGARVVVVEVGAGRLVVRGAEERA